MTPREYVEDLRHAPNAERIAALAAWLETEKLFPTWGEGGRQFIIRAKLEAQRGRFDAWLATLRPCLSGAERVAALREAALKPAVEAP